jgi:hypothetical protein
VRRDCPEGLEGATGLGERLKPKERLDLNQAVTASRLLIMFCILNGMWLDRGGELSAAVELRRLFPGVTDNAQARECARTIAAWEPLPVKPRLVRRLRPRKTP